MSTSASDLDTLMAEQKAGPKVVASAPINQPPHNDIDPGYLEHRNGLEGRAALSSLMSENASPTPQKPGEQAKSASDGEPKSGAMSLAKGLIANKSGVGAVASDVGRGALEAPKAIALTGPRDALESMLDGAKQLGDWTNKYLPAIQLTGEGAPRIVSAKEREENPNLPGSLVDSWHLPKFDEPTSVTGGIVKSASQFITSMATLGRVFGPMGAGAEGLSGHLATMGKSGAAVFAGFEKADGNIADLIQKVPALQNPITDFLSSKPNDTEIEGRLKNALTGVGFGELANGIFAGLKMLRGALTAKEAMGTSLAEGEAAQPAGVETPAAFKFLGDPEATPDQPLASIKGSEQTKAAAAQDATADLTPEAVGKMGEPAPEGQVAGPLVPGATEAQAKEPQVYINFARIDTPDDVKRTLSQLADAQKDNIDVAARGIQSFEATKLGAQFQDAWQVLMDRRIGQPLNDQEMLAGRQLLAQSAMKTDGLTDMAIQNPTPENVFAWRKQMQTHAMIQAEVSGAQREIARSLSAMRIPVGANDAIDRMAAIQGQLDQMGGLKSNLDFLRATKTLIDSGKLEMLGDVADKTLYATTRDALITGWTNGLLTNPLTHVKVNLSNIGTIALRLGETRVAEAMDKAAGVEGGVAIGETAQVTAGLVSALKDSFRYVGKLMSTMGEGNLSGEAEAPPVPGANPIADAARAFKSGRYSVGEEGHTDWTQVGQGSSDALSIADSGWVGKATDLISSVVTSPGRALAGEHEFYRSIGMRMELNRFAYRQAINELNSGKIESGDVAGRVADLVENPTKNITTQAVDGMTYQTFTDAPGKFAQHIEGLRNDFPLLRVVIPFYKIPSRIMSFTFERTPLAPLMSGWRADIAAGGARQSMALAKTGIGSAIMLAASDAVLNGKITGGGPQEIGKRQAMLDQGWLPYSAQTPSGRWIQYNRLETVGSSIALAADITETTRHYFTAVNGDNSDVEKLTAAGIAAIANNVTSKTYFEGLAKFFETISDPRANAEGTLKSFAGSIVPAGVAAVDKLTDPYQRATYSMLDAIKARIPGASETLAPRRGLWGQPVEHASGLGKVYDAFVPFASKEPNPQPIDKEIGRLNMNANLPPANATFGHGQNSAKINLQKDPDMYSRYVELSGNAWKDPAYGNLGARDLLNQVVGGSHWLSPIYNMKNDDPGAGDSYSKAGMIKSIMDQYREGARGQLLKEYPQLQHEITEKTQTRQALRMPVLQ